MPFNYHINEIKNVGGPECSRFSAVYYNFAMEFGSFNSIKGVPVFKCLPFPRNDG